LRPNGIEIDSELEPLRMIIEVEDMLIKENISPKSAHLIKKLDIIKTDERIAVAYIYKYIFNIR